MATVNSPDTQMNSELLQWSLDMVKSRVTMMAPESRKAFISILTSLIEKSPDPKLLKVLTKIVEEWVKSKVSYYKLVWLIIMLS